MSVKHASRKGFRRPCLAEIIVIEKDDRFTVHTSSPAGIGPVGPRLERDRPLPGVIWSFKTRDEAERAAQCLRSYVGKVR